MNGKQLAPMQHISMVTAGWHRVPRLQGFWSTTGWLAQSTNTHSHTRKHLLLSLESIWGPAECAHIMAGSQGTRRLVKQALTANTQKALRHSKMKLRRASFSNSKRVNRWLIFDRKIAKAWCWANISTIGPLAPKPSALNMHIPLVWTGTATTNSKSHANGFFQCV